MNIEQQRSNFQRAYVKTDYYKIHYEKTNAANSTFSWNNEANRYTWHDVNSAWGMWLAAQQQHDHVTVPVEPTWEMIEAGIEECSYNIDDAIHVYKAMIQAAQE